MRPVHSNQLFVFLIKGSMQASCAGTDLFIIPDHRVPLPSPRKGFLAAAGIVHMTWPNFSLQRIVVLPAASRPTGK